MKKQVPRKISVVRVWTISYIAIFIIPTIVSLVIYAMSANMIREQVRSVGYLSLQNVREQMDAEIASVMSDSFEVRYQNDFRWLGEVPSFAEADAYKLKLAVDSLRDVELMKNSVDGVLLYFPSSGIVVSNINTQEISRYYDYYYSEFPSSKAEWMSLVQGDYYDHGQLRQIQLRENSRTRPEVYFIKSTRPAGDPAGYNVVMQLPSKALSSIFNSPTAYEGATFVLLDQDGGTVYSSREIELHGGLVEEITSSTGGFTETRIGGVPYVVIHLQSQVFPAKYAMLVSQEAFYNKFAAMRYMIFVIVLLSLAVGALVIVLAVRLNYNPLRRLLALLHESVESVGRGNEYSRIEQAIGELNVEKSEADRRVYQQERALRTILLNRLLHGTEQFGLATQELLEAYRIKFESHYFAVVSIAVDDASQRIFLDERELAMESKYRQQLAEKRLNFVISNVMEELLSRSYACHVTNTDGMTSCLLNLPDSDAESYRINVNKAARELAILIRERFDSTITVAASDITGSITGIPSVYSQIGYTLEYGQSPDDLQAIFYTDVQGVSPGLFHYPPDVERQLMNLIKEGSAAEAAALIDEVFLRNTVGTSAIGVDMAKFLAANITGTLLKAMEFSEQGGDGRLAAVLKAAGQLHACKTMEDLRKKLDETVAGYMALLEAGQKSDDAAGHGRSICDAIEEYVRENYNDIGLSIAALAEHLGVNATYCSRVMRRERGVGLLDYINSYRVEKAKELIAQREEITVEEIALSVGFATAKTLTRCFKKYAGTTPGRFKSGAAEG